MNASKFLTRANPLNYLVGKIFLGFWLVFALTVISMSIIVHTIDFEHDQAVPGYVQSLVRKLEQHFNAIQKRRGDIDFERFISSPRVGEKHLFVYFDDNNKIGSSKLMPPDFNARALDVDALVPYSHIQADSIAYGPFTILDEDRAFRLFAVYPYRPHPMLRFKKMPIWLRLGLPLLITGLLSFFVATSLVTPIKKLRNAHRQLAEGQLDTRSNGVALRNDELGQLGRDFDHMAVKIADLLVAQKRLLGDVSHELRSPLARLQIALGLALQPECKDLPRHLQRIELEANRLDQMIGDVLRLSRLETQLQGIELHRLSINGLLQQLIKDANFEAADCAKQVTLAATDELCVMGDQTLLASAFENVIRNAVKYTEDNTQVNVTLSQLDNQIIVVVRDHGPGVPTSSLTQVFEPFYRVSDSRQRSSGGTGLGLAIAQKAVRSHGGSITASNHCEKGLEITITLPLA